MKKIIFIEQEPSLKLARQPGSIHCSKLTIKTVGQGVKRQLRRSGVFIVKFEQVIAGWADVYFNSHEI